jgi:large subunit ribosomal protein L25
VANNTLAVELREETGKGVARKLRVLGRVPAVVYGHGKASLPLVLDPIALEGVLRSSAAGLNTLIELEGDATISGKMVLVKDLQRDPVRGQVIHADLFEIDTTERISVSVPVRLTGIAEGVTMGGLVDHVLREIELDCLPGAIPDEFTVDVTHLGVGDAIHVSELEVPDGVHLRTHADLPVVSVVTPAAEEEPEVEEGVEGEGIAEEGAAAPAEGAKPAEAESGGDGDS